MKPDAKWKAMALDELAHVSLNENSLAKETVMNQVGRLTDDILKLFQAGKEEIKPPKEQLAADAAAYIEAEVLSAPHASDYHLLFDTLYKLYRYLHDRWAAIEADHIIDNLKNGPKKFARKFFYSEKDLPLTLYPMISGIVFETKKNYGVDITPDQVGCVIHEFLWADGTWKPFETFRGESTIYQWLSKVARNAVKDHLIEEKLILPYHSQTHGNYRLLTSKMTPAICTYILNTEPMGNDDSMLLEMKYVDKLPDGQIMSNCGWDCTTFNKKMKHANNTLTDYLLRSDINYGALLKCRAGENHEMFYEDIAGFTDSYSEKIEEGFLSSILGNDLPQEEAYEMSDKILREIAGKIEFTDNARTVFYRRYFYNESPEELALELNMKRSNVDNIYSRWRKTFYEEAQRWYERRTHSRVKRLEKAA